MVQDSERIGRLYLCTEASTVHIIDVTLLPRFRSHGIGARILRDLCEQAARDGRTVSIRIGRRDPEVTSLVLSLGFRLVSADDLDNYLEWTTASQEETSDATSGPAPADSTKESPALPCGVE